MAFSARFLRAVVAEIARCENRIDRLDARIERTRAAAAKDKLSVERAEWVRYERWLREHFLA